MLNSIEWWLENQMLKTIVMQAPAKINYLLDVIGRRPNGYHDLRMIMQRVNLCDEIEITLTTEPGISVSCGRKGVPDGEGNIAWKAARSMLELSDFKGGVRISLVKNIPVAAGLGGGSSDCAAVLLGLDELLGLQLSRQQLMDIGVKLGADVPFFVFQETALAEGIGEKLTAIEKVAQVWVVLVNPNVPVSTAWVYQNLQLTGRKKLSKLPRFLDNLESICGILSNDLESVTIPAFPVIAEIKQKLISLGAAGAMMSGSGPTVFGLFADQQSAEAAGSALKETGSWFVAVAETV